MQNLQQKLVDQGVIVSLVAQETGQQITLRYAKGETRKAVRINVANSTVRGELRLEAIDGAAPEQPNLRVVLADGGTSQPLPEAPAAAGGVSATEQALREEMAKLGAERDELAARIYAQKIEAEDALGKLKQQVASLTAELEAATAAAAAAKTAVKPDEPSVAGDPPATSATDNKNKGGKK